MYPFSDASRDRTVLYLFLLIVVVWFDWILDSSFLFSTANNVSKGGFVVLVETNRRDWDFRRRLVNLHCSELRGSMSFQCFSSFSGQCDNPSSTAMCGITGVPRTHVERAVLLLNCA